jgi:type I restriction enzyme S subunit
MTMWLEEQLSALCRIVGGGTPSRQNPRFWHGRIPWASVKDFKEGERFINQTEESITEAGLASSASRLIPAGTPLICTRMAVGRSALSVHEIAINQDVKALCPNDKVSGDYLQRLLQHYRRELERIAIGSTVKGISTGDLLRLQVIYPQESDEQVDIANVLDAADSAIRKTEAVIGKLRQIKIGFLHDLLNFGVNEYGHVRDPIRFPEQFQQSAIGSFPNTWTIEPLSKLLTGIDAGDSPSCPNYPAPAGEWGILKVSAVTNEGFVPSENKHLENARHVSQTLAVRQGDLLITRCNTPELVGAACLVDQAPPPLLLCDKTLRLLLNPKRDDPRYVLHALRMPQVRRQIEISATGSSGSMKNISQNDIRGYLIPRPPTEEQRLIACKIGLIEARIAAELEQLSKAQALKAGLAHDLLTGTVRVPITASVPA